jgi:hypothetical protein
MNDEPDARHPPEPSDAEMGSPIGELADIGEPTSLGFFGRVRNSIDRRRLGSDLSELSWNGVISVMLEFVDMAVQLVTGTGTTKKRR